MRRERGGAHNGRDHESTKRHEGREAKVTECQLASPSKRVVFLNRFALQPTPAGEGGSARVAHLSSLRPPRPRHVGRGMCTPPAAAHS